MNVFKISKSNRGRIQNSYIDSIISRLNFIEIRQLLRDMLHDEKSNYTNEELADEIKSRSPEICKEVFGKSYSKKEGESHETR